VPGGIGEPLGLLAFPAIKFAGYTAYAVYLNRVFPRQRNVFAVGASRMVLGLAFGTILAMLSFPFAFIGGVGLLIYLIGLVPVRLLEWYIILKGFYIVAGDDFPDLKRPMWIGVLVSFLLDIPALIGLVTATGFWIC
jgi:hypothetical protein